MSNALDKILYQKENMQERFTTKVIESGSGSKNLFILDVSGSMWGNLKSTDKRKIEILFDVLSDFVQDNVINGIFLFSSTSKIISKEMIPNIFSSRENFMNIANPMSGTTKFKLFMDFVLKNHVPMICDVSENDIEAQYDNIVLITDGMPDERPESLIEKLKINEGNLIPINTIFLPTYSMVDDDYLMKQFAQLSNGKFFDYSKEIDLGGNPRDLLKEGIAGFLTSGTTNL